MHNLLIINEVNKQLDKIETALERIQNYLLSYNNNPSSEVQNRLKKCIEHYCNIMLLTTKILDNIHLNEHLKKRAIIIYNNSYDFVKCHHKLFNCVNETNNELKRTGSHSPSSATVFPLTIENLQKFSDISKVKIPYIQKINIIFQWLNNITEVSYNKDLPNEQTNSLYMGNFEQAPPNTSVSSINSNASNDTLYRSSEKLTKYDKTFYKADPKQLSIELNKILKEM